LIDKVENKFNGDSLLVSIRKNINNDFEFPETIEVNNVVISVYTTGIAILRYKNKKIIEYKYKHFIANNSHTQRYILISEYFINYLIRLKREGIYIDKIHYVGSFIRYSDGFSNKMRWELEAIAVVKADLERLLGYNKLSVLKIKTEDIFNDEIIQCVGVKGSTVREKGNIVGIYNFIQHMYNIDVKKKQLEATVSTRAVPFEFFKLEHNYQLINAIMGFNSLIRKNHKEFYYAKLKRIFKYDKKQHDDYKRRRDEVRKKRNELKNRK